MLNSSEFVNVCDQGVQRVVGLAVETRSFSALETFKAVQKRPFWAGDRRGRKACDLGQFRQRQQSGLNNQLVDSSLYFPFQNISKKIHFVEEKKIKRHHHEVEVLVN